MHGRHKGSPEGMSHKHSPSALARGINRYENGWERQVRRAESSRRMSGRLFRLLVHVVEQLAGLCRRLNAELTLQRPRAEVIPVGRAARLAQVMVAGHQHPV